MPGALAVLALALLGYVWARRVFDDRTALYTGLATLTSAGVFLFTRVFIPEALFSLFLAIALYAFLSALAGPTPGAPPSPRSLQLRWASPWFLWTALALAVLTKGFVALIFFFGTAAAYLTLTSQWLHWRRLRPFTGIALFLAIAAPWHILASLRNTGGAGGHGFAWFYFINEHVLRFLGRRTPRDYNKLPGSLYWSLHLIWLFPWSLFAPLAAILGWRNRRALRQAPATAHGQTAVLLTLYSALILCFFALSTNQEYYTFPAYLPLLLLGAAALTQAERTPVADRTLSRALLCSHAIYTALGVAVAAALTYALWISHSYAPPADIGALLAHRNVSNYTLSMASFFDLTGRSFAALRLPATLAALAFAIGPVAAWTLRQKRAHLASTLTIVLSSAVFLIAAHIALIRFAPMLSCEDFAGRITALTASGQIEPDTQVALFGDQAYGSSIPFYLHHPVLLVDGRTTSMYFGSTFPDAPPIFLTAQQLLAGWGQGPRKILFIPVEHHDDATRLLGSRAVLLAETSGKLLVTDRPIAPQTSLFAPQHNP